MLDLLFPRSSSRRAGSEWFWGGSSWIGGRVRTNANLVVDPDIAMTYSCVWCATRILAETAASLPLITYRLDPDGKVEQAVDDPLYHLLKFAPNPDMGSMAFREGRTMHQVNWGNGFAEIERDKNGDALALWPIHPSRVRPTKLADTDNQGRYLLPTYPYQVRNNDGSSMALKASEMLHVPGVLSEDGVWGKGTVAYARESIGMGLATERHGAAYFGSGAQPKAVLKTSGMKDPEVRAAFRKEWKNVHNSPDSSEIAIIGPESEYIPISLGMEDSQFLGTRTFNVREIARWYRIPSYMLSDLEKAGYNSIEMLSLEFVIYSLLPWLRRWEEQIMLKLIRPEDRGRIFVEHQLAGLLRGDVKTRYESYKVALEHGFLSINEVRRLENMNAIGSLGDNHYVMANMTTVERLVTGPVAAPGAPGAAPGDAEDAADASTDAGQLLDIPDNPQETPAWCGPAATLSVAQWLGVDEGKTQADLARELNTTAEGGTHPRDIIGWFNAKEGLSVTSGSGWTLDDLKQLWQAGHATIIPCQDYGSPAEERNDRAGHYVVILGFWSGMVFLQDPSASNTTDPESNAVPGRVMVAEADFDAAWHDIEADGTVSDHFGIAVGEGLLTEPDEDDEAADTTDEGDEANAGGTNPTEGPGGGTGGSGQGDPNAQAIAAARSILTDTLGRMFSKEANECRRASDKPDFEAWLTDFGVKHERVLTSALAPLIPALATVGIVESPESLAHGIVGESATLLRVAFNTDTKPQLAARLSTWAADRTVRTVEAILSTGTRTPASGTLSLHSKR